jgi:hypothetical protein
MVLQRIDILAAVTGGRIIVRLRRTGEPSLPLVLPSSEWPEDTKEEKSGKNESQETFHDLLKVRPRAIRAALRTLKAP